MKVDGSGGIRPGQGPRTRRSDGAAFLAQLQAGQAEATAPGQAAVAAAAVGPLFAMQEVDDALTGRRKAVARAETILAELDDLRLAILAGTLSLADLHHLQRLVQTQRHQVDDSTLQGVLDEIDLRAQVEIAKLTPS